MMQVFFPKTEDLSARFPPKKQPAPSTAAGGPDLPVAGAVGRQIWDCQDSAYRHLSSPVQEIGDHTGKYGQRKNHCQMHGKDNPQKHRSMFRITEQGGHGRYAEHNGHSRRKQRSCPEGSPPNAKNHHHRQDRDHQKHGQIPPIHRASPPQPLSCSKACRQLQDTRKTVIRQELSAPERVPGHIFQEADLHPTHAGRAAPQNNTFKPDIPLRRHDLPPGGAFFPKSRDTRRPALKK